MRRKGILDIYDYITNYTKTYIKTTGNHYLMQFLWVRNLRVALPGGSGLEVSQWVAVKMSVEAVVF